jgi:hypothetical protein
VSYFLSEGFLKTARICCEQINWTDIDIIYQQPEVERLNDKERSEGRMMEYHAFMLRLRRQGTDQRWFLTVEDPHTRERRNFKNVELFVVYLLTLIGQEEFNLDTHWQVKKMSRKRNKLK